VTWRQTPLDPEHFEEWCALEQQAMERLRRGCIPSGSGLQRKIQLLVLPSFTEASSWEICQETFENAEYVAIHSIWHRKADIAKLESPVVRLRHPRPLVPTIEARRWSLETAWVDARRKELTAFTIPAIVDSRGIGLDGTSYEVAFDAGLAQARYRWWHEPPSEWRALHLWLQQTLEALEKVATRE